MDIVIGEDNMNTIHEESVLTLLNQFNTKKPVTVREVITNLGREGLRSMSASVRPIPDYIVDDLNWNRSLKKVDKGYVLTQRGEVERERLRLELASLEVA